MSLSTHAKNYDGNLYALDCYMAEQDADDAHQARIDVRTNELITDHTDDIDDMIVDLLTENPEKAHEILNDLFIDNAMDIRKAMRWFYNEWIPERCEILATEEINDE